MRVRREETEIRKRFRGGVRRAGRTEEESPQPRPGLPDPTRWIPGGTERTRRPRERSSVQVTVENNTASVALGTSGAAVVIRAIRVDGCVVMRRLRLWLERKYSMLGMRAAVATCVVLKVRETRET